MDIPLANGNDDPFSLIWWFILPVLLLLSALISGSEVAFFSLSAKGLDALDQEKPGLALRVRKLLGHPRRLLATILIANNFINIAIVIISGLLTDSLRLSNLWPYWAVFLFQVVAVTFLILLFGEILPKVFATQRPLVLIRAMTGPLIVTERLTRWLSTILLASGRIFDRKLQRSPAALSPDELSAVIDMTHDDSVSDEERKIWKGIVEFGQISVSETMKPRIDVVALDSSLDFMQVLETILQSGYSRIPVYTDSFDQIKGVLYIKDLLPHLDQPASFPWANLVRKPFFVPENKPIDDLLKEFQEKKMHMAIVVDEYGGSSGIITLEDVIEEIVGEINDEFDDEEVVYSRLDNLNYVFEGKTTLVQLCRILDIPFDHLGEAGQEADTLAGLLLHLHGKMPLRGEQMELKGITFTVESADTRRIKRVKVQLSAPNQLKEQRFPMLFLLILLAFWIFSCGETPSVPKPRGYPSITLPPHDTVPFAGDCPFVFYHFEGAKVRPYVGNSEMANPCWFNLDYPRFNAALYLTYLPITSPESLGDLIDDAHQQVFSGHSMMASAIGQQIIRRPKEAVFGTLFKLEGKAATPFQFYLTDSSRHFLRGSLYFNFTANYDSLAPVVSFLHGDIQTMVNSLRWEP